MTISGGSNSKISHTVSTYSSFSSMAIFPFSYISPSTVPFKARSRWILMPCTGSKEMALAVARMSSRVSPGNPAMIWVQI